MKILLVKDNRVVNIVKGSEEFIEKVKQQYSRVEPMPNYEVRIGAVWNGTVYNNPKQVKTS